jgi:glycerol kinase
MQNSAEINLQVVRGNGGMVKNQFMMQLVADIAQVTVHASNNADISPLGAALAGGFGLGVYKSLDDIEQLPLGVTIYEPEITRPAADTQYAGWQAAIKLILPT